MFIRRMLILGFTFLSYSLFLPACGKKNETNNAGLLALLFASSGSTPQTPVSVSGTVPVSGATGVAPNSAIAVTFNHSINPATVTGSTVMLKQGTSPVTGSLQVSGQTVTLTPSAPLSANTLYSATITAGVTDTSGISMPADYTWTFTTGAALDTTAPTVSSTTPTPSATNVALNTALSATFSEPLNASTVTATTFTLKQGASAVAGTVAYSGTTATFTPSANLAPNKVYTATIKTGVTDLAGNSLAANHAWTFTTTALTATVSPSTGNFLTTTGTVRVVFSNSMNTATLVATMGATGLSGVWSTTTYTNDTVTFNGTYTIGLQTFTLNATDLSGTAISPLTADYTIVSDVRYVSTTGIDTNTGLSPTSPKLTIPSAITAATAPGAVLVAAGTYSVDSGSNTHVILKEGVSLSGGYSADFSTRNPATNTTTITDTSTLAGVNVTPNRAVEASGVLTSATLLDGFTINGSSGGGTKFNSAIAVTSSGGPTISHNILNGGGGSGGSDSGIYVYGLSANPVITNNTINGGGSFTSNGVQAVSLSNFLISNNIINGGAGSNSSIAIQTSGSPPIIKGNTLNGGSAPASFGISNTNGSNPTISENTINGGSGSTSTAIENWDSSPTIVNNTIDGGAGSVNTKGIYNARFAGVCSPAVKHNTINGGSSGDSVAVLNSGASGTFVNNILFTSQSLLLSTFCMNEATASSDPAAFQNNDLFNCGTLYYDEGVTYVTDTVTVVANGTSQTLANWGNVSVDPLFVNQAGGDWHLTASSPVDVREGGLNLTATVPKDKDAVSRTAVINGTPTNAGATGVSIGAYEKD